MNNKRARLLAVLSAALVVAVWLIEFTRVLDGTVGKPIDAVGRIVSCTEAGTSKSPTLIVSIDPIGAVRFGQPRAFHDAVLEACERQARVQVVYQAYKPIFRDEHRYSLRGMIDVDRAQTIVSPADYQAWKERNRLWAQGVLAFSLLSFVYASALLMGVIRPKDVAELKRELRGGHQPSGDFLLRSRQRTGEAFAYIVLFTGISVWFGYEFAVKGDWLLLGIALFMLPFTYAYIVDVVNTNVLRFDDGVLVHTQGPLPWFNRNHLIPVTAIKAVVAEQQSGSRGSALHSVAVDDWDDERFTLFWTNTFEEAQAIADITEQYRRDHYKDWREAG